MVVLAGSALLGCHKAPPVETKKAELKKPVVVKTPEEMKRDSDAAKQSLESLKPLLANLDTKVADLHKHFDVLPPSLPDFTETRAKFYGTAEGLGMMSAKVPWLSGRIDSAVKAGDGAEMNEITKDIAATFTDVMKVDHITMELAHEVVPFEKAAEDLRNSGKKSCD